MVIVMFGVTGVGKTRVGTALAESLGWPFVDADDFHNDANVAKLQQGIPLGDTDRWPWLARLRIVIQEYVAQRRNAVVACSALKQAYRESLRISPEVVLVYLKADRKVLEERLLRRRGHFMNPGLLTSQLDTLEEPLGDILTVDTARSPAEIVEIIRKALHV